MNLAEILLRYPTPIYLYDLDKVTLAYNNLLNSIPDDSILYYSVKANPHPEIIKKTGKLGCHLEVSSLGEIEAVQISGHPLDKCLFTGPAKTEEEIENSISRGIRFFSIESIRELILINQIATKYDIRIKALIRINPTMNFSSPRLLMMGGPSQFGIEPDVFLNNISLLKTCKNVNFLGFHMYMGSNIESWEKLYDIFHNVLQFITQICKENSLKISYLNLGGGFGNPFANNANLPDFTPLKSPLTKLITDFKNEKIIDKEGLTISFESGRYLVGSSGTLFASIISTKESKGQDFLILNTGIHHFGGMAGLRRIPSINPQLVKIESLSKAYTKEGTNPNRVNIVGPLCTPLDYFARDFPIEKMEAGDILSISNVGAYGLTGSLLGFLSYACPSEIIIEHGKKIASTKLRLVYDKL